MSRALLVGMDVESSSLLREAMAARGVTLEPLPSPAAAAERIGQDAEALDALVIGPLVQRPLSLAQQSYQRDRDLAVLILTPPERLEALRASLAFAPFIGQQTHLLCLPHQEPLADEVERAISDTRQRRAHHRTLRALSSKLSASPALRPQAASFLDRLLALAPVGVLTLDAEGRVLLRNQAAQQLLGPMPTRQAEAPPPHHALPEELHTQLAGLLAQVSTTGGPVKGLLERKNLLPPQFLEATLAALPAGEGEAHTLVILEDTTERIRGEREREALLQELEAAVRARDEFLSLASHELRTPLTAMLGWLHLLRTRSLSPEKQERALETVERSARQQAQLIEDLLDVSRIVTGKLRMETVPLHLSDAVRQAVDSIRPAVETKGIQLHLHLDGNMGPVLGDPRRLQQVAWNLLSNAVKFTPTGGHIHVGLRQAGTWAELSVRDTGEGIAKEFLPFVFERFRQADSSTTRRHGGLGLGLSIVQHIVDLHGGQVEAFSDGANQGTTFTVRLPLSPVRPEDAAGASTSAAIQLDCPPGLEGTRVLLVEDEPDVRELMVAVLEHCKVKVTAVGSAEEALLMLEREVPDVLVSDIGMPREDGYSLIRKVRALPPERGGKVPALAVTAHARAEDRKRALLSGFQMHLGKPVAPEELLLLIATLASRF